MKLSATHTFNCIVLMVKFGRTSCEDIPLALLGTSVPNDMVQLKGNVVSVQSLHMCYSHSPLTLTVHTTLPIN